MNDDNNIPTQIARANRRIQALEKVVDAALQRVGSFQQKIAAVLLMKLVGEAREPAIELTEQDFNDLEEMLGPGATVVFDLTATGTFVLRLVDGETAAIIESQRGARPS